MMRARHRRSLATPPEGWLARYQPFFRRPPDLPRSNAMVSTMSTVSGIELQELGSRETSFVRAVVKSVEIEEEGLFRHIAMYL